MRIKICILIFFFSGIYLSVKGQEIPESTQQQLEYAAEETQSEVLDAEGYLNELNYFRKHPIELNRATGETLKKLHLLTELQINNLIHYRQALGKLIDIYELQSIPGWDLFTISNVIPYVAVGQNSSLVTNLMEGLKGNKNIVVQFSRVLEKSAGYDTSKANHFLGDPNRIIVRYSNSYKGLLQFGITASKDAGEPFLKGTQSQGFDYYSFHLFVRSGNLIKALALGDYTVNLGQGLIQWQAYGPGKSSDVLSVKKESAVLMPYKGLNEVNFRRGAGITFQKGKWESSAFASYKKISGHLLSDTSDIFTSIYTAGLHRTATEIASRNTVTEISAGGNITFSTGSLKAGFNMVKERFSIPFQKKNAPYNYFAFTGKDLLNTSLDYSYTYKNIHLFGEAASDKWFHTAFLNGALVSLDPKLELSLVYRNISEKYQSLAGKAFTENSIPVNERGLYIGISLKPTSKWILKAYSDMYCKPFLSYRISSPVNARDYLLMVQYFYNKQLEITVSYRSQVKPSDSTSSIISFPEMAILKTSQLSLFYKIKPSFTIRAKAEKLWNTINEKDLDGGYLIFLEGSNKISRSIRTKARVQYFDAKNGNAIYSYAGSAILTAFVPAFFNKGIFYQAELKYYPTRNVELNLNCVQTIYKGENEIGSGLDKINGNKRSEIKIEVHYNFL